MLGHSPQELALSTDLYELTMADAYHATDMRGAAVFSLFVRKLPPNRTFLVAAGIEQGLRRLIRFAFDREAVDYVVSTGHLKRTGAERLASIRFTGNVWAVREGCPFFADEPLLEVEAPILEAQLAETLLLNAIHFPTLVATKAGPSEFQVGQEWRSCGMRV